MNNKTPQRLIIVSNRLPFQLKKVNGRIVMKQSDGGLVSALKSYFEIAEHNDLNSTVWIGSAEFSEKRWQRLNKRNLGALDFDTVPVFFEKKLYNKYYNGFCNATLWPLFHYFPSFVEFDNETFKCYEEVNQAFADRVLSILQPGDAVWIHDYQLMLVPGMIRRVVAEATIGFFLHIPFPSFEVFRMLHRPWKEKIIDGLLGADLVGFHTHEYVQHFLKTIRMVRGFDHQYRSINVPHRLVKADMFPLGVDFSRYHNAPALEEVQTLSSNIAGKFSDKKIIFSVDRLDYTKGITHRLSGFERFLELYPEWKEKVVFVLVVVPSRQIISRYNERKKLIEEEIGRINGKYSTLSWQPIIYRYNQLAFHELSAMYHVAHIALITPLRDGMNLVAKEYVASRHGDGVLVLSELAGAANELSEAILVNPMDREEMANGILSALMMPPDAQKNKIDLMQRRLNDYTVEHWMKDFLKQLSDTKMLQDSQKTKFLSNTAAREIVSQFKASASRMLMLDYDGTLVPFARHPSLASPDKSLLELLSNLSSNANTEVTIISGRDNTTLERWFSGLPINLVAEHGAAIRLKNGEWQYYLDPDQSWKSAIVPTLEIFRQRSPGSFIEEKQHTLVWHYRNVDPELGFIRSRELLDNLYHLIMNSGLNVIDGNKVIEVRKRGVDKGVVTRRLLEEKKYDFILAIGDDKTDEDMFRALPEGAYSVKIGPGHTLAQFHFPDHREVLSMLSDFLSKVPVE